MKKKSLVIFISFLFFTSGIPFVWTQDKTEDIENIEPKNLPLDELRIFTEIFEKIKTDYVNEVSDRELLENAIHGMLAGLDPHSAYLVGEAYRELQEGTSGKFGGLGIEVGMEDGFVKVITPIDGTPAAKAKIKAGDLIIKLDDTPVKGLSLSEAVKLMRGYPGTKIVLTVIRKNETQPLTISIVRDYIRVQSVRSNFLEPNFGYLRISQFQSRTTEDVRKAIEQMKNENGNALRGVLIDMRNNPGGVLSAAVGVSDLFLQKGIIVYTKGRIRDSQMRFNASPVDILSGIPIVVLVNAGSASASEIVAGALQDHRRAIIVGNKTFGKGSVQTILPVTKDAALKLTTARYYTPSGNSIQTSGITPDIIIQRFEVNSSHGNKMHQTKEIDLNRHLESHNDSKEDGSLSQGSGKTGELSDKLLVTSDYELYEALNVLKSLAIAYDMKQ